MRARSTFKAPRVLATKRDGFTGSESNDCTVWTLAAILCIPYADAHALLKRAGRREGAGAYSSQVQLAASFAGYELREHSKPRVQVTRREKRAWWNANDELATWTEEAKPTAMRVLDFVPARGHFYVSTGHHAFAVIDGVIYDNGGLRPRCRISRVYELVLE